MILVDGREGSYKLPLHRPLRDKLPVCRECKGRGTISSQEHKPCRGTGRQLATLNSADVCVVGRGPGNKPILFGIEVKTVEELLGSASTGRLQSQLYRMLDDYDVNYVVYYGVYRENANTGLLEMPRKVDGKTKWEPYAPSGRKPVYYSQLRRMMMELSAYGIASDSVYGTGAAGLAGVARWVVDLYELWSKPFDEHDLMKAFDKSRKIPVAGRRRDPRKHRRAEFANVLDDLGIKRAMAAAEHFGSIREMVNASPEEWAEISYASPKGRRMRIGPVLARSIDEQLS